MLGNKSKNSPASNVNKRQQVSRKITRLVDDLPLFPTDTNQLFSTAVKPAEDGTEILRLIESNPSGEILAMLLATKILNKLDLTPVDFEKARDQYESRTQNSN